MLKNLSETGSRPNNPPSGSPRAGSGVPANKRTPPPEAKEEEEADKSPPVKAETPLKLDQPFDPDEDKSEVKTDDLSDELIILTETKLQDVTCTDPATVEDREEVAPLHNLPNHTVFPPEAAHLLLADPDNVIIRPFGKTLVNI